MVQQDDILSSIDVPTSSSTKHHDQSQIERQQISSKSNTEIAIDSIERNIDDKINKHISEHKLKYILKEYMFKKCFKTRRSYNMKCFDIGSKILHFDIDMVFLIKRILQLENMKEVFLNENQKQFPYSQNHFLGFSQSNFVFQKLFLRTQKKTNEN